MFLSLLQFFATKFLFLALHLESGCFPRPLTAREEAAAFSALRAGDAAAREKLIRHNLRLVAHIVKKYYALPGDQEDLVSIGTIGLMKAVDTFDATRKARFSTYASRCIENAILSPAHFGMEKRIHPFHAVTYLRQSRAFISLVIPSLSPFQTASNKAFRFHFFVLSSNHLMTVVSKISLISAFGIIRAIIPSGSSP